MNELQEIGTASTFTCPECNGTLWEVSGSRPPRFRCHTGHAFSLTTLADSQHTATEDALWMAMRALQEKEALLRRIARLDRTAGDLPHASQSEAEADHLARQFEVLRQLVASENPA